jgi:hypothetical protein
MNKPVHWIRRTNKIRATIDARSKHRAGADASDHLAVTGCRRRARRGSSVADTVHDGADAIPGTDHGLAAADRLRNRWHGGTGPALVDEQRVPMLLRHYALRKCVAAGLETVGSASCARRIDSLHRHRAAGERAKRRCEGDPFHLFVGFRLERDREKSQWEHCNNGDPRLVPRVFSQMPCFTII